MTTDLHKKSLGQYFTKNNYWLKDHIIEFINQTHAKIAFDPFAGGGDLLSVAKKIGFKYVKGFDIDLKLNWTFNDSLIHIPKISNSLIITNPPYLTNYSAKRKKIYDRVKKYFNNSRYDDVYQIAIEKCFNNDFGIMIIPETFINSNFPKSRLTSITIIEDQLFNDTENPICIICFNNRHKTYEQIKVYKNEKYLGNLKYFEDKRRLPNKKIYIKFNVPNGRLALRAVDTTNPQKPISFMKPQEINYNFQNIRSSSRLITLIELNINNELIEKIIYRSNNILTSYRKETHDVLLSPFKGNKKNGERRRRLDYLTARSILEEAYDSICSKQKLTLF